MAVVRFYSNEAVQGPALQRAAKLYPQVSVTSELCYNVELTGELATVCHEACEMEPSSFVHTLSVSSYLLLQAARVSARSRPRSSSGCFVLPCRQSRCLRGQI